jgi:arginine N-succinyltransferase
MFVVRPVETSDIPALQALAASLVSGMPGTHNHIEHTVERSLASFAAHPCMPGEESYCFVLEPDLGQPVAGAATVSATAGMGGTFFAFRTDAIQQVSRDLHVSHSVHALTLCSDLSACSQLRDVCLRDRRQLGSAAQLLSRARLLFAAMAPQRFSDRFIAAMPGVVDADGRSPFWEALGRKFFQMDLPDAERLIDGARNRTLIVEMMPHYPVYVPLLPADAQAAMGQVQADDALSFRMLSDEGFAPGQYIDIFHGGPILQAHGSALRTFSQALPHRVTAHAGAGAQQSCLIAAVREEKFRAVVTECALPELSDSVALMPDAMRRLDVATGDAVLCVKL